MTQAALTESLNHPALLGVETLPVGSAKVPRLPCLTELVEAPDVPSAAAALLAHSDLLEAYAAVLEAEGLDSMAATLRRVLARATGIERMNSDLASVITWVLNAQHKTAGRATMRFAPWAVAPESASVRLAPGKGGAPEVTVSAQAYERMAEANIVIYERIVGLLNTEAVRGSAPERVLDRLLRHASQSAPHMTPRFVEPGDVKSLLKIDYKMDVDGRLVIVDVNAGLIGAWFDDLLLDEAPDLMTDGVRITPRLAAAVLERFRLERRRSPRRIALCVLDEQMYEQWADADIAGLKDELLRQVSDAGAGSAEFVVIDASGLESLARGEMPRLLAGEWSGAPDLVVFYSCRIAPHASPAVLSALEDAGVTLVDGAVHGMAAGKELATPGVLGHSLPDGVRLPETFVLGAADGGADAVAAVREAWQMALKRGWRLLAVKIDKQRRAQGAGDFPSAYLYPVTAVGRQLVERQIERTFEHVTNAAGRASRLVVTQVDHLGGCDGVLGRRDVELRTYAFPVIPRPGS